MRLLDFTLIVFVLTNDVSVYYMLKCFICTPYIWKPGTMIFKMTYEKKNWQPK